MMTITVDTSVVAKWYSEENENELIVAGQLRKLIIGGEYSLVCPQIITLELANVLKFSKKMSQTDCLNSVTALTDFCAELIEFPKMELITNLMYKYDLTSYDGAFVALAEKLNVPLITADYKHHKKSVSKNIIWLKEWKGRL